MTMENLRPAATRSHISISSNNPFVRGDTKNPDFNLPLQRSVRYNVENILKRRFLSVVSNVVGVVVGGGVDLGRAIE